MRQGIALANTGLIYNSNANFCARELLTIDGVISACQRGGAQLETAGDSTYRVFVGNFMTSLDMEGSSLSLMMLDDELRELLDKKMSCSGVSGRRQGATGSVYSGNHAAGAVRRLLLRQNK